MDRKAFFYFLDKHLSKVPPHDRKEMLYDFEEHFDAGIESGKTEEQVANELGNPKTIARDLLLDYRITKAETDKSVRSIFHVLIASISLSFFNLIVVLGPILALLGVFIAFWGISLGFTLAPVAWLVSFIFGGSPSFMLLEFFVSLTLCGLGLLIGAGMYYVGKGLYRILLNYVKLNVRMVKGVK